MILEVLHTGARSTWGLVSAGIFNFVEPEGGKFCVHEGNSTRSISSSIHRFSWLIELSRLFFFFSFLPSTNLPASLTPLPRILCIDSSNTTTRRSNRLGYNRNNQTTTPEMIVSSRLWHASGQDLSLCYDQSVLKGFNEFRKTLMTSHGYSRSCCALKLPCTF